VELDKMASDKTALVESLSSNLPEVIQMLEKLTVDLKSCTQGSRKELLYNYVSELEASTISILRSLSHKRRGSVPYLPRIMGTPGLPDNITSSKVQQQKFPLQLPPVRSRIKKSQSFPKISSSETRRRSSKSESTADDGALHHQSGTKTLLTLQDESHEGVGKLDIKSADDTKAEGRNVSPSSSKVQPQRTPFHLPPVASQIKKSQSSPAMSSLTAPAAPPKAEQSVISTSQEVLPEISAADR